MPIAKYIPPRVAAKLDRSQHSAESDIVSETSSVGPQPPPQNDQDMEFMLDAYSDCFSLGYSRRSSNEDDYFIDSYKLGEGLFHTLNDAP